MEDLFSIPVTYQEKEYEFEARLLFHGYIHRVEVTISGIIVLFEPDEERNYRSLVNPEDIERKDSFLSRGLLGAIAQQLEGLPE